MKKLVVLLVALAIAGADLFAAQPYSAKGRVVDQQGKAVGYATVVLLQNDRQAAGTTSDSDGRFTLHAPAGEYTLSIQFLGYKTISRQIKIEGGLDLGELILEVESTQIEGIVVTAQSVRREADRFVVDVANSAASIGKDGVELLEHAPGVWIENDRISINGKSGSKVYINERELRMGPEQMLTYLRSLRAEEIQKIEVVPTTGADYDADSAAGIIKITLKKRRENGIEGSLSMRTTQSDITSSYAPSGNINVHAGKLDLYGSAWGQFGNDQVLSNENTVYSTQDATLASHSLMEQDSKNFGANIGAVYEINPKHSIGAEFDYWQIRDPRVTESFTDFNAPAGITNTRSRYDAKNLRNAYTATFNYIWKIDSIGSTAKVLADYTYRTADADDDNVSRITSPVSIMDSIYRDNSSSIFSVGTVTLALDKKLSKKWGVKAGLKYTYNDMQNAALYEYMKNGVWVRNDQQSFDVDYTENIAAAYGTASATLGRWSLVAGMRGEYTHTYGKSSDVGQDYFSLFPNANISYALTKDTAYSLIAQYARKITRPSFWSLNPQRIQISDYTYQTGNPDLDPAYAHDLGLTLVMKYKYTFTVGMSIQKGEIQQSVQTDPDNPDLICLGWANYDKTNSYYAAMTAPIQLRKWWTLNASLTYLYQGQRLEQHSPEAYHHLFFASATTTFILPAKFYIDISYRYQSRVNIGNLWVESQNPLQASLKKRFGESFTATFTVRNILNERQRVGTEGDGFVRHLTVKQPYNNRAYMIGLTYNFKSGKAFRKKTVEAGSGDEKSRLSK